MSPYVEIVLILMVTSCYGHGDLVPFEPVSCPEDDPYTHTCYEMTETNISCTNDDWVFHGCWKVGGKTLDQMLNEIRDNLDQYPLALGHGFSDFFDCYRMNDKCPKHECVEKCCDGWARDNQGQCSIKKTRLIYCENGGEIQNDNTCSCPDGFQGEQCETPVCEPECQNGGTCTQTHLGNMCNCPGNFVGPSCAEVECSVVCLNGGRCITKDFRSVCRCEDGYTGRNCAYKLDLANCPAPNSTVCRNDHCWDQCKETRHCPPDLVCCNDGCCNKCVKPQGYKECWYGDNAYRPGQVIKKDKCTTCVCLRNGTFNCTRIACPIECPKGKLKFRTGECCPVCDEDQLPPGYHPPILKGCPDTMSILSVASFSSRAYVTGFPIRAYDFEGKALSIWYDPVYLDHCGCPWSEREYRLVTVSTSTDKFNRKSQCRFFVLVTDKTPPKFYSCPATVYVTQNEKVSWARPRVLDNVGVRSLTLDPPGRGNDGYFPLGNHTMTYTATDYDGNSAFCQFTVFVYDKDSHPSEWPPGLAKRQTAQHRNIQIIAGCLTVFFLVISVILMVCFIRRWRHRNPSNGPCRRSRRDHRHPSVPCVSNGLYDDTVANMRMHEPKPPPYSPPIPPPPAYEELAVTGGATAFTEQPDEVEQPPKYADIYSARHQQHQQEEFAYDNMTYDDVAAAGVPEERMEEPERGQGQGQGQDEGQGQGQGQVQVQVQGQGQVHYQIPREAEYDVMVARSESNLEACSEDMMPRESNI